MRIKILGGLFVATAACLAIAATAGAVVTETPAGGRIGYLPMNETPGPNPASPVHATVPNAEGKPPLLYNGGPVMHSQVAYAIFWAPSGYSFPIGYRTAVESYLQEVAADSRKSSNVYSVSAQYTDGSGNASYVDSFGGAFVDTAAYPTSGTCPTYSGAESFTACITDEKMEDEVDAVVSSQGWPRGLGAEYYVVLPPHAGSCFESTGHICFDKQYCAYHSYSESFETVYANISYSPGDVVGCGVGEYPNGHSNGNVDDTLSSLSHEANESITDPTLEAWFDEKGLENGDECRNTPHEEDYGASLGGSAGSLFNQEIDGGHYYLQQEWSNNIEDCAQRVDPASPSISGSGQLAPGQPGSFDGGGSAPGETEIVSYAWKFGDGATATGESVSHAFGGPGTFAVTLTVEDEWGLRYSATSQVVVAEPTSGGGGSGATASTTTQPPPPVASPTGAVRKTLTCHKGFRKARKHGKVICVKAKHHRHRHG